MQGDQIFLSGVFDPVDVFVMAGADFSLVEITSSGLGHGPIAGGFKHRFRERSAKHQDAAATASMVMDRTGLSWPPTNTDEFPTWS